MLKKTIKYTDYDGNERVDDFYFSFNKAELMEMQLSKTGGIEAYINKLVSSNNNAEIVAMFKDIILKSYGEKSLDGKRFIKNDELRSSFEQTEAFSELFMELATDAKAAADFINAVVPSDVSSQLTKEEYKVLPGKSPIDVKPVE